MFKSSMQVSLSWHVLMARYHVCVQVLLVRRPQRAAWRLMQRRTVVRAHLPRLQQQQQLVLQALLQELLVLQLQPRRQGQHRCHQPQATSHSQHSSSGQMPQQQQQRLRSLYL